MKKLILFMVILMGFVIASPDAEVPEDGCYTCHSELDADRDEGDKIMTNILDDIHIQRGLNCSSCHGGNPDTEDPDEAMWDNDTFVGAIDRADQPQLCGKCHADPAYMRQFNPALRTDQLSQYWTSNHGIALKKGDSDVAVCTSCHNVHGIRPVDDPRSTVYPLNIPETCGHCHSDQETMRNYDLPIDQLEKYKKSVHGMALLEAGDVYAPTCNDCHGNHGATPPDVGHISDVCGTCHVNNATMFRESHMSEGFLKQGFSQCASCHGKHEILKPNDEMLKWSAESMCHQCHPDGGDAEEMSTYFYEQITGLSSQIHEAEEQIQIAENKGMEISDLYIKMEEAHKVLIQARTTIHTFNKDKFNETTKPGYESVSEAKKGAFAALESYKFRQKGLFAFSLILSLFVVAFYFKIKDIDSQD